MTYCVEVWGNTYRTYIDPIVKLQKRAIRIINKVSYCDTTNELFIESCTLKFIDIVYLKTLEILFRVKNKSLPNCIQHFFKLRETNYDLRRLCVFEVCYVRTNVKYRCVSFLGAKLWNKLSDELKMCRSLLSFKKTLKCKIIKDYNAE